MAKYIIHFASGKTLDISARDFKIVSKLDNRMFIVLRYEPNIGQVIFKKHIEFVEIQRGEKTGPSPVTKEEFTPAAPVEEKNEELEQTQPPISFFK